jgi:ADP-ribosylglycohydrolase
MTTMESERRARITGMSRIRYWIENDIVADESEEMPIPHYQPVNYIKVSFLWSLNYLMRGFSFEDAIKDMISRGGDTRSNAGIVGGLFGAAN